MQLPEKHKHTSYCASVTWGCAQSPLVPPNPAGSTGARRSPAVSVRLASAAPRPARTSEVLLLRMVAPSLYGVVPPFIHQIRWTLYGHHHVPARRLARDACLLPLPHRALGAYPPPPLPAFSTIRTLTKLICGTMNRQGKLAMVSVVGIEAQKR